MSSRTRRSDTRGFTLIEAMMAMLIVSVLVVASMRATAAASLVQYKTAERATARLLADGMMADILPLSYLDPGASPVMGRESGESSVSKAAWNDVDDFDGWIESPPQVRDGSVISGRTGWSRSVKVEWVNPANVSEVVGGETGAKRITVTASHNGMPVVTRIAIRTAAP